MRNLFEEQEFDSCVYVDKRFETVEDILGAFLKQKYIGVMRTKPSQPIMKEYWKQKSLGGPIMETTFFLPKKEIMEGYGNIKMDFKKGAGFYTYQNIGPKWKNFDY